MDASKHKDVECVGRGCEYWYGKCDCPDLYLCPGLPEHSRRLDAPSQESGE